jgi:hypothetical protein
MLSVISIEESKRKGPLTTTSAHTKKTKTYNRRDSQMVTHSSTSRPVQCLCMAERTGCPVLTDLWSYVLFSVSQGNKKSWLHRFFKQDES